MLRNDALAQEFAGFVAEKQEFYEQLMERLEINSSRLDRDAKALAASLGLLNRRGQLPSFDRDAVSLLTIPIGQLEQLIENLDKEIAALEACMKSYRIN